MVGKVLAVGSLATSTISATTLAAAQGPISRAFELNRSRNQAAKEPLVGDLRTNHAAHPRHVWRLGQHSGTERWDGVRVDPKPNRRQFHLHLARLGPPFLRSVDAAMHVEKPGSQNYVFFMR